MTQSSNINLPPLYQVKLARPSLKRVRNCLTGVFEHDPTRVVSHRVPFSDQMVVVNNLPGKRNSAVNTYTKTADFTFIREDGVVGVRAQFQADHLHGFQIHEVGFKGKTIREGISPAVGFVAVIGEDSRSFGVAGIDSSGELLDPLSQEAAYAITSHGLERAFRCSD